MENKLPSEPFRPEDEYPELGAQPIEAAEPVKPEVVPDEPEHTEILSEPVQEPTTEELCAPAAEPVTEQLPPAAPYPQPAVPYMGYPAYPPYPAMPYPPQPPYPPQQAYPQPPYPAQPYPQQGMPYPNYPPYYAPYPPQTVQPVTQQPVTQQPVMQQPLPRPVSPAPEKQQDINQSEPELDAKGKVPDRKKPASTGTKAFLIILSALLLAMVAGFIVYIGNASSKDAQKNKKTEDPFSLKGGTDDRFSLPDVQQDAAPEYTELEDEVTLVADDGATQKRDTDNPDSVGKPDKDAKGIELEEIPKDADDTSKYTAKSSFNALVDSVVTISCYENEITENIYDIVGSGSGTVISEDGYIITNAHVLGNSKQYLISVTMNDGKKYQAKVVGYDTWSDLAVLKIDAKDLTPATFGDSDKIEVGDDVIAIGSPGGAKYQNSLTLGVVSAVDREISVNKYVRYIQSDAAINPGSSGGPLCNLYGQVIGITTAKTVAQNYESMSFSIPSAVVKEIVTDLLHYGYVPDRARIGFTGREVDADEKLYYGIPSGIIVTDIADDGALKDSKVQKGDVITAIDGEAVGSFQDIYNILAKHKKGDKIKLSIYRVEEKGFFDETPTEIK